jgi:tRNA dimethylallyltransferase
MLPPPFSDALILTGPTGSGKTQLALSLARRLDAEIISMDSMALYRRMDVGTAKPTRQEQEAVRHHLVDVLEPWESASVAWWLQSAAACCREIAARGKQILIAGGTPLYLKAIRFGLFDGPPADEALRKRLRQHADTLGAEALHAQLAQVDPITAERLPVNDLRRVIRALEVFQLTGQPISAWQRQWSEPAPPVSPSPPLPVSPSATHPANIPRILWLDLPRSVLYDRINRRVVEMFAGGLIEEVRALVKLDKPLSSTARQALGYKEVIDHLNGRCSEAEALTRVQTRSRNFAKRQITWFRHLPGCQSATPRLTETLWQPKIKITDFRLQI